MYVDAITLITNEAWTLLKLRYTHEYSEWKLASLLRGINRMLTQGILLGQRLGIGNRQHTSYN